MDLKRQPLELQESSLGNAVDLSIVIRRYSRWFFESFEGKACRNRAHGMDLMKESLVLRDQSSSRQELLPIESGSDEKQLLKGQSSRQSCATRATRRYSRQFFRVNHQGNAVDRAQNGSDNTATDSFRFNLQDKDAGRNWFFRVNLQEVLLDRAQLESDETANGSSGSILWRFFGVSSFG